MIRDFVSENINIYDLVLATEVGVVGVAPTIGLLTIGGGVCFGKYETCKFMVNDEETLEELLQRPEELRVSTKPEHADYQKQISHNSLLQNPSSKVDMSNTVAAKLYAGFSTEGDAFFMAGITKVSLETMLKAFSGEDSSLPTWAKSVSIEPYAQDECDKHGGTACFAILSFSAKETKIRQLVPPLVIPRGFAAQGRIKIFGSYMAFNVGLGSSDYVIKLESSPIKLFNGGLVIRKTKGSAEGPFFNLQSNPPDGGCKMCFGAYVEIAGIAEGSVNVDVTESSFKGELTAKIFGSEVEAKLKTEVDTNDSSQLLVAAQFSTPAIKPLEVLVRAATDQAVGMIHIIVAKIETAKAAVENAVNKAQKKIDDAEAAVAKASDDCKDKVDKFEEKKKVCGNSGAPSPPPPPPPSCNEELTGTKGSGYRGCQTKTKSGKTCQRWDTQDPHKHGVTPEKNPNAGLTSNYCRNPDGESAIWCYTTDKNSRWELCEPKESDSELISTDVGIWRRRRRRSPRRRRSCGLICRAKAKAKELKDKAFTKAKELKDKAIEIADKAIKKGKEVKRKATRKAKELADKAVEKAEELADKAVAKVEEVKYKACSKAVSSLADQMRKMCNVPKRIANNLLSVSVVHCSRYLCQASHAAVVLHSTRIKPLTPHMLDWLLLLES